MNPGGKGYSEPRSCYCTPTWATRVKVHVKKKTKIKELKRSKLILIVELIEGQGFQQNESVCENGRDDTRLKRLSKENFVDHV